MSISQLEKPTTKSSSPVIDRPGTKTTTQPRSRSAKMANRVLYRNPLPAARPVEEVPLWTPERTQTAPADGMTLPLYRPESHTEPAARSRRSKVSAAARIWSGRSAAFASIMGLTYLVSALTGQVMLESARRQELTAKERASSAHRAEASLREQVYTMLSGASIERWATSHSFVTPDQLADTDKKTGAKAINTDDLTAAVPSADASASLASDSAVTPADEVTTPRPHRTRTRRAHDLVAIR